MPILAQPAQPFKNWQLANKQFLVFKRLGFSNCHQRVALQQPPRARRQRAAVFRADRAGPNHVEVPRKRSVVPAPDVAQDGGLKFRHDVQGEQFGNDLIG